MDKFNELSCTDFTEKLASSSSVPGGGGASALAAALGIALGSMVGAFTVGKPKYRDAEPEILLLMKQAEELRKEFLDLIEEDAAAFEPLSKAYALPKDAPGRDETMEQCLRAAAAVPLRIFDLCCRSAKILNGFAKKGSRMLISDAATGAKLCQGALYGAAINVKVNTKLMKDRAYAQKINEHIDEKLACCSAECDEIYQLIADQMS